MEYPRPGPPRVVGGDFPGVDNPNPSECSLHVGGEVCSNDSLLKKMKSFIDEKAKKTDKSNETNEPKKTKKSKESKERSGGNTDKKSIVEELKKHLNVNSESEAIVHPEFRKYVGENVVDNNLKERFLPAGPYNSDALLDNFNIDENLRQWAQHGPEIFSTIKKGFYHVPFQMIDFAENKTELATLDIVNIANQYDAMAVVLNTDVSTGRGKHWFCLFCDFRKSGEEDDPYTLEFFNSSGNHPEYQVTTWLNTAKSTLLKDGKKHAEIVISAPRVLQQSKTECGMWSLMYIKSRLEGRPTNWFYTVGASDDGLLKLRASFFRRAPEEW